MSRSRSMVVIVVALARVPSCRKNKLARGEAVFANLIHFISLSVVHSFASPRDVFRGLPFLVLLFSFPCKRRQCCVLRVCLDYIYDGGGGEERARGEALGRSGKAHTKSDRDNTSSLDEEMKDAKGMHAVLLAGNSCKALFLGAPEVWVERLWRWDGIGNPAKSVITEMEMETKTQLTFAKLSRSVPRTLP